MNEALKLPWPSALRRLRVGVLEIDLRYRRVVHSEGETELTQRVFDLLLLFLAEPGVLHSRCEIFRRVWPGVVVEDANLTQSVWMLRKALGVSKGWVRTVAKQGYVFDPPMPVEAIDEVAATVLHATSAADSVSAMPATAAKRPAAKPWLLRTAVLAAGVVLSLGAVLVWSQARTALPRRVVLVASADAALAQDARWPAELLHAWLDWKLRSTPTLSVLDANGDEPEGREDTVVVLSVAIPADRDGEWQVSARLRGPDTPPAIVAQCPPERLVATLDAVSRQVHAALAPAVDATMWPLLDLDPAAAGAFVAGLQAEQQHRRGDAVRNYRISLEAKPGFGYVRLKLAENLVELGQQGAAEAELARAAPWISTLGASARAPIEARALAIRQEFDSAAAAFAALSTTNRGEAVAFQLAQARNLRRAGRARDALQRLAGALPAAPAAAQSWLIERALAEIYTGDPAHARVTAGDAVALASRLGWDHERARATLLLAEAETYVGAPVAGDVFEQAALGFTAAGDRLGALRARFLSEVLGDGSVTVPAHLGELLAEAHAAGNVAVEIDALRRTAFFHYRAGAMTAYRERLSQAVGVAESVGDRHARNVMGLDLLHQDVLRGDFAAIDQRLSALRAQPTQGVFAFWLGHFDAGIDYRRGRYQSALSTLNQTENYLRSAGPNELPAQAAGLACLRGAIGVVQGESAQARLDFARCRSPHLIHNAIQADLGDAEIALQGGDLDEARRRLGIALDAFVQLKSLPDRWILMVDLAPLLARSGDPQRAQQLLQVVLPAIEQAGYTALARDARVTLAEIALAEGRPEQAAREASGIAATLPADDWQGRRRLRTVMALIAQSAGDIAAAARDFDALDADARARGDVLAELLVHSLIQTNPVATRCSSERHRHLLAQSGMRGASDAWMVRTILTDATPQLAAEHGPL